jgi:succinoglycan biosynthesis transport protein ExoP
MNMNSWDSADGPTEPSPARSRQNGNHTGVRSTARAPSENRGERATALPAPRAPDARGESGLGPRFLRAHLGWILLIALAVTAGAYVVAKTQKAKYTAQATVVVFAESASANSQQPVVMATEKGIVSSRAVLSIAARSVEISETALQNGLSVTVPVDTDLLQIAFSDPNPLLAQRAAEGIAYAYVAYRTPKPPVVSPGPKTPTTTPTTTPVVPGAVRPSLISDAALPSSPTSPSRWLEVGVALILGLALGTGVALVRDALDDRLRGPIDLATQANAPVLALIPAFRTQKRAAEERLVMVYSPTSRVAEAYRDLRTRVLQAASGHDVNTILVTSSGREDKATVAANLSAALALSGRRVILVCADLRWGRTHELFGLSNGVGLTSVLSGRGTLEYGLRDTRVGGLQLLSSGPATADPAAMLLSPALPRLLGQLRGRAEFVVIDAPPVLATADTEALAELSHMILFVADARLSTRSQVRAATHQLGTARNDPILCVFDNVGRAYRLTRSPSGPAVASRPLTIPPPFTTARPSNGAAVPSQPAGAPAMVSRPLGATANISDPLTRSSPVPNGHEVPAPELPGSPSKTLNGERVVENGTAGRPRKSEQPPSRRR